MTGVSLESVLKYVCDERTRERTMQKMQRIFRRPDTQGKVCIPSFHNRKIYYNYAEGYQRDGISETLRLVTSSGKEIILSETAYLLTAAYEWVMARELMFQDMLLMQGEYICVYCHKEKPLTGLARSANFKNVCKECCYDVFRGHPRKEELYQSRIKDRLIPEQNTALLKRFAATPEKIMIIKPDKKMHTASLKVDKKTNNYCIHGFIIRGII